MYPSKSMTTSFCWADFAGAADVIAMLTNSNNIETESFIFKNGMKQMWTISASVWGRL